MDAGVSQPTTLVLGLGSCRVDHPASSPLSSPPGWISCIALANLPLAVMNKRQVQFSSFRVLRISLPTPTPSGPALLCCPGIAYEHCSWWGAGSALLLSCPRDQLSHLPQALTGRTSCSYPSHAMTDDSFGLLAHAHNFQTGSPTTPPMGLSLLCCQASFRVCFPECCSWHRWLG